VLSQENKREKEASEMKPQEKRKGGGGGGREEEGLRIDSAREHE